MSGALSSRRADDVRCVDPTCRHSDGYRWVTCPVCKTSIFDPRFVHPDANTTYARLREPAASDRSAT